MELLRSHSLARVQGQQQQQLGQQQQFALQQMNGGGNGGPSGVPQQQSPFHDPLSNQQPHMSPNFPAMGGGNLVNAPSLQQGLNNRTMMQAFQASQGNHPGVSRQLELMGLAQNQQPQNGPINFRGTEQQQQQQRQQQQQQQQQSHQQQIQAMNQPSQDALFSSPGMASDRRPSPAHPNLQPANPMGGQQPQPSQPQPQRRVTMAEISERATMLRGNISAQEQAMAQFSTQRASFSEQIFQAKMRQFATEIKNKKEYLGKMIASIHNAGAAGANMYVYSNWRFLREPSFIFANSIPFLFAG